MKIPFKIDHTSKSHNKKHYSFKRLIHDFQNTGFIFKGIFKFAKEILLSYLTSIFTKTLEGVLADIIELSYTKYLLNTHNCTEFAKKKMKKFLECNQIKFVHGRSYNPCS